MSKRYISIFIFTASSVLFLSSSFAEDLPGLSNDLKKGPPTMAADQNPALGKAPPTLDPNLRPSNAAAPPTMAADKLPDNSTSSGPVNPPESLPSTSSTETKPATSIETATALTPTPGDLTKNAANKEAAQTPALKLPAPPSDIYTYKNDAGNLIAVDSLEEVPKKFRKKAKKVHH